MVASPRLRLLGAYILVAHGSTGSPLPPYRRIHMILPHGAGDRGAGGVSDDGDSGRVRRILAVRRQDISLAVRRSTSGTQLAAAHAPVL